MRLFRSNCLVAIFCLMVFSTILAAEGHAQTVKVDIEGEIEEKCLEWWDLPDGSRECVRLVTNWGGIRLTVNGINVTGSGFNVWDTNVQIAAELAQGINASVPNVSATTSGSTILITPQNPFIFTITSSPTSHSTFFPLPPFSATTNLPDSGTINPKFLVLAVTYAPPGQSSTVTYGSSRMFGTSSSLTETFKNENTVSAEIGVKIAILGFGAGTTASASTTFTEQQDTTSSIAVNKTATTSFTVPGPASSADGVNHDFDIIWVWLNPRVHVTIAPNNVIEWDGFSYDARDPSGEMEVVPLFVTWLRNPSTIPPNVAAVLARSWDTSGLGGLTTADYAEILKCNPFSNPLYVPDPTRFDLQGGQTFSYQPPPPGGQPITQTFTLTYQTTTTAGTSAESRFKVAFSLEKVFDAGWFTKINLKLKDVNTTEWINKWSALSTTMTGQTSSLTIRGPAFTDNYTGPTQIQVYKDNVYGTFMFHPVAH